LEALPGGLVPNAKQAAIRAGYSAKTAKVIGAQNLSKLVVGELHKLASANMLDYMKSTSQGDPYLDFSALTRDQAAAAPIEVTVEDLRAIVLRALNRLAAARTAAGGRITAVVDLGDDPVAHPTRRQIFPDRSDSPLRTLAEADTADLSGRRVFARTPIRRHPRRMRVHQRALEAGDRADCRRYSQASRGGGPQPRSR
jgi:hypothetical protein